LTSLAFYWFAEQRVDLAVIEVGLGGRFDATNVVENVLVSVITNIDLDHTHILGNTVEEIAFEKSGIIKAGVPVVSGATGAALDVIRARCDELGCKLYSEFDDRIHRDFDAAKKSLALLGSYQQKNGLLAVAAFHISGLTERCKQNPAKVIQSGFETAYWPGRLQLIRGAESKKEIILDGAHNTAGAVALRSALDRMHPDAKFQFVIGCFENKNARQIVDALVRTGDSVYASQAATKRATYDKEQLALFCKERGASAATYDTIADAFHAANANAANAAGGNAANAGDANPANFANVNPADSHMANASVFSTDIEADIIVVTGSFATVREVMLALGWKSVEDGSPECVRISDGQ
jgi:dihydrofolate synthase/folylpolyglutamate synthase